MVGQVFVDDMALQTRGKIWYRLVASDEKALHEFAAKIGLRRDWCHETTHDGRRVVRYGITPNMRQRALKAGAMEVTAAQANRIMKEMTLEHDE